MKRLLLLMLTGIASQTFAQKFTVKGQLIDTANAPLASATVLLLNPTDSSLVNFAVSNAQGGFEMRNVAKGDHLFRVSFLGFATHTRKFSTGADPVIDLGSVKLEPVAAELAAIEIEAERAPVTVKRDTIEFNAGSFKTKENAVVEDLLKKLPGVEVDNDGNITAQGEQVRRVTVDGKNFFGTDPKLATRNLPADAVNKVQVFDKKSDQAAFTGVDDGQREKTINLELKEEKRKGAFGTMMAGGGTDNRFMGRASINKFTRERQLSFLAMGNNVNQQGFSMEDYMNFTGGSQQMFGGGGAIRLEFNGDNANGVPMNFGNRANGIMTNYAAGVNVNNEFSKKTEVNGSYFFNYLDHFRDQSTFRQNFLPAIDTLPVRSFTYQQNSTQLNNNANHRFNTTLDHKLDSTNSLKLTTNVTYNETDMHLNSNSETFRPDGTLQNGSQRLSVSTGATTSVNASMLWRHKFSKKGRNMTATAMFGLSDSNREGVLMADNHFYRNDEDSLVQLNQTNFQTTGYNSYGGTATYTEPLGKRRYIEASYNYRQNLNDVKKDVFDRNNGEPLRNEILSNEFSSNYQYHRPGLNFRLVRSKYNLVVGGSLQYTDLHGDLVRLDTTIDRSFQNVLPSFRLNYDFSNMRHLRFDYETSVQEPSIQQLQPVVDNSDPLNVYVGNPNLRPAYAQSWRVNFTTFDPATFVNFFAFVNLDYITNAIVNSQSINEQLAREIKPVNVDNSLRLNSNANFGFPINKIGSRFNFGANYRADRSLAMLNDRQNQINQETFGGVIRYSYRYKEIVDISLSADVDRQRTRYSFNQPEQSFTNATYSAEGRLTFFKNYQFNGNLEYLAYRNEATGFDRKIPLLGLAISRYLLKNKSGELKLEVSNLLDRALGIDQTASVNYLERQTTNSMGRYFMLSFTYALNKQLNPMGMRRGGAVFRMMR